MAPTVIAFGLLPGLPIDYGSGPLFPAAATTTIVGLFFKNHFRMFVGSLKPVVDLVTHRSRGRTPPGRGLELK